jgi:histone deacetylase complex regulatory component SIN3
VATQPGFLAVRLFALLCERLGAVQAACAQADASRAEEHPLKASVREEQADPEKAALAAINGANDKEPGYGGGGGLAADGRASAEGAAKGSGAPAVEALAQGGFKGWLGLVAALLAGRVDASKYDDACRALVGPQAYLLSTFDKVVGAAAKALQAFVADRHAAGLVELYQWHRAQGSASGAARYLCHAQQLLEPLAASPGHEAYQLEVDHAARTLAVRALGFATAVAAPVAAGPAATGPAATGPAGTAPSDDVAAAASPPPPEAVAEAAADPADAAAAAEAAAPMDEDEAGR